MKANGPLRAMIYLLDNAEAQRWARLCVEWCERKGYEFVSVVADDQTTAERWPSVIQMLATGEADVCVVPHLDYLPPDRLPRVELVVELAERRGKKSSAPAGAGRGLRAVIYLLDNAERDMWERVCREWAQARGYHVALVIVDDERTAGRWRDVVRMFADGTADVCLVARLDQFPAHRLPRVEMIADQVTGRDHPFGGTNWTPGV